MNNKKGWMQLSLGALILSLVSLFLPVISYGPAGRRQHYNVLDLLTSSSFIENVLADTKVRRTGGNPISAYFANLSASDTLPMILMIVVVLLGVGAVVAAFVGIISMSKQYESAWPFRLAAIGLVGTAIPALVIMILILVSMNLFNYSLIPGTYVYVTPAAMVAALVTVTSRNRMTKEEQALAKEAAKYLRPAGDLPESRYRRNTYGR